MGRFWKIILTVLLVVIFILYKPKQVFATIVFSISSPIVNSDDEIEVQATISGLIISSCSISGCYLQAELQSAGGYFGYTYNNSGEYVDYFKSPATIDEIKTKLFNFIPLSGSWTGKLKAKNNPSNSNYYGPGDYLLSFRRFSGNSLTATGTDSNNIAVTLALQAPAPSPADTPSETFTPTPAPTTFILKTSSPVPTLTPTSTSLVTKLPGKTPIPTGILSTPVASSSSVKSSVLGAESLVSNPQNPDSDTPKNSSNSGTGNKNIFLPVILILIGVGFITTAIVSIIKSAKKDYTGESEKQNHEVH